MGNVISFEERRNKGNESNSNKKKSQIITEKATIE